jgi:DNA repair exonuclease SbcCD ATPase subunit
MEAMMAQTEIGDQAIADFRQTESLISELSDRYGGLKPDTKENYELVRVGLGEMRALRVKIEARRKELKQSALDWGRKVDSVAGQLTKAIESFEHPLKRLKDAVDSQREAEKRAKEESARLALEAKIREQREAEEARLRAEREAEALRLAEERKQMEEQRKAFEAEQAIRKAEHEKAMAEARAERERIQAEHEARRREQEARIATEQAKIEAEQSRLRAEKDRLDRLEFERQAKEKAEKEARERAEFERVEAERKRIEEETRAKAEAERLEALKPDREKVLAFARKIRGLKPPTCQTEEGSKVLVLAMAKLVGTVEYLEDFASGQK